MSKSSGSHICKKEHEQLVSRYLIPGMSYRLIDEYIPTKSNIALTRLFLLFKQLPKSKNNYYLSETYKAEALSDSKQQKKAHAILSIQQKLPHFYAYDTYLQSIKYSCKTNLRGIDKMIVFTEIYDDFYMRDYYTSKLQLIHMYIAGITHANMSVFLKGQLFSLEQWHCRRPSTITTNSCFKYCHFGSTQLGYIHQFKSQPRTPKPEHTYFYYGCGIGLSSMVEQEIEVIELLSDCINEVSPTAVLFVRPYPNFNNWDMYKRLLAKAISNLTIVTSRPICR